MRNISLQPETTHQASSKDVYTDMQMTDVNDHDASDELELHVETNGQDVAEDAPRFPTKDTSTSDESDQEAVILAPSPAEQSDVEACSNAAPGKQSTNRNVNPSTVSNYIQSASRPRPRVWISSESIRANDSSSLGHGALSPKPRRQKPSPPIVLSPEVEVHNVDPVEESYASLMPSPSSSHEGQEEEPTTVTTGAFGPSVIDETATPIQDPETIGSMQDVSRVVGPRIERFHGHEKDTSGVKIMILETLRNKKRETQTTKNPLKGLFYTNAYPKWWHRGYSSLDCDPSDGYIYMFTTDKYKGHVKIGSTKKMPEDRVEEWKYRCKTTGEYIPDPNIKPFRHYRIVENIVHAALYNERRKIACGECNRLHLFSPEGDMKMHGEWFEVPEDRALKIIEKWRSWVVKHEPYTPQGVLRDFWIFKYEAAMKSEVAWENWDVADWWSFRDYVLHHFTTSLKTVAPILFAAMFAPTYTLIPLFIFIRFGFGVMGWGVVFLVCLLFLSFKYKFI
jgi:hypothetical protein